MTTCDWCDGDIDGKPIDVDGYHVVCSDDCVDEVIVELVYELLESPGRDKLIETLVDHTIADQPTVSIDSLLTR